MLWYSKVSFEFAFKALPGVGLPGFGPEEAQKGTDKLRSARKKKQSVSLMFKFLLSLLYESVKNGSGKAGAESESKNKEKLVFFMISAAQQQSTYFPGAA